jgi:hypothetical protein
MPKFWRRRTKSVVRRGSHDRSGRQGVLDTFGQSEFVLSLRTICTSKAVEIDRPWLGVVLSWYSAAWHQIVLSVDDHSTSEMDSR